MLIALVVVGWVACGIVNYGLQVAYFQRTYTLIAEENKVTDRTVALLGLVLGPIGLLATLITGQYTKGWML